MMKKFCIGDFVREGGPFGPISEIIDIQGESFVLSSFNNSAKGYLTAEYLYPVDKYEQMTLF